MGNVLTHTHTTLKYRKKGHFKVFLGKVKEPIWVTCVDKQREMRVGIRQEPSQKYCKPGLSFGNS